MKNLILIGAGGHCTSCIDVIEQEGKYRIAGILDVEENLGKYLLGYMIIGTDKEVHQYVAENDFLCTLGIINNSGIRQKIFRKFSDSGARFATVVSPKAQVSKHLVIGAGSIIMHHATVNANVRIGLNCIINTGANIEHDSFIGNGTHISTNAVINGSCHIGENCFVGSNATIIQGIILPEQSIVGAGAVLLKSFTETGIFVGNPAREKKI